MQSSVLKIDPKDNVLIALTDLYKGERITYSDHVYILKSDVPAKHKFAMQDLSAGEVTGTFSFSSSTRQVD